MKTAVAIFGGIVLVGFLFYRAGEEQRFNWMYRFGSTLIAVGCTGGGADLLWMWARA